MKKALFVFGLLFSLYWGYSWFTEPTEGPVRVRFSNATEDTGVRIWRVAFDASANINLTKGEQKITDVLSGDRAFIVYEPLNEQIIAIGKTQLKEEANDKKNVDVVVRGNKRKGYTISFESF